MSGGSKIVIDADNGKIDAANKKSQEGFQRTAKEAAKVGSQIDRWGRQLGEKVAGLGAIVGVMRQVGQEVERQQSLASGAHRKRGGGALGRSADVNALGLNQGPSGAGGVDAVMNGSGRTTTMEQDDAFLGALAAAQKSNKRKMDPRQSMQALSAFGTGAFSQEELVDAAGNGKMGQLIGETGARLGAMSPQAREELEFRRHERATAAQVAELTAKRGGGARIKEGQEDVFTAQNPFLGGFRNVVRNSTGGGLDLLESESVVGKGGSAMLRSQDALLQQIADNTKPQARPTMATTTEGGP